VSFIAVLISSKASADLNKEMVYYRRRADFDNNNGFVFLHMATK